MFDHCLKNDGGRIWNPRVLNDAIRISIQLIGWVHSQSQQVEIMLEIRLILGSGVLVAVCGIMGCGGGTPEGPRTYQVVGTVSYTGEPLKEADLLVRTADGKHAAGTKVTNGKFQVRVPAGASIVEITAMRDIPGEFREENPGERVAVREQFIPAKYNTESTLKLEVTPTTKDIKFELMP